MGFGVTDFWVQIPAALLPGGVTMSESLYSSEGRYFPVKIVYFLGCFFVGPLVLIRMLEYAIHTVNV